MAFKGLNVSSSSVPRFVTITELSNVDRNFVNIVDDFSKHYKILIMSILVFLDTHVEVNFS